MQFLMRDLVSQGTLRVCMQVFGLDAAASSRDLGDTKRMTLTTDERGCTERLARFFPSLPAVRIPVQIFTLSGGRERAQESTILEFGAKECAIFQSRLALEFDDRVRVTRDGGGHPAEATVIALQYHDGSKAVAIRFLEGPCAWMERP